MRNIWAHQAISTTIFLASLTLTLPVSATPPVKERLPLTLTGSGCNSKETEMNAVLQAIPGVTGVYFNRVPDHVLVDIIPTTVKPADVITHVNEVASSWQCKVEIIEGCISVPMPTASAAPHQHE
jgi:hypothetical protein